MLLAGRPPSWISATIELTPLAFSSAAYLLIVLTSLANLRPLTPSAVTMFGVPSRVTPMKPTFTPCDLVTQYGASSGLPVFSLVTLAER